MKFTISYEDAVNSLRHYHGIPAGIPIEIQRKNVIATPTPKACSFEENRVNHFINEIQKFRMTSDEKIAAILKVRELGNYSLTDAKFIVENWGQFVISCNTFKRLPKTFIQCPGDFDSRIFV